MGSQLGSPLAPHSLELGPEVLDTANVAVWGPGAASSILAGVYCGGCCVDMPFGKGDYSAFLTRGEFLAIRVRGWALDDFGVADGGVGRQKMSVSGFLRFDYSRGSALVPDGAVEFVGQKRCEMCSSNPRNV